MLCLLIASIPIQDVWARKTLWVMRISSAMEFYHYNLVVLLLRVLMHELGYGFFFRSRIIIIVGNIFVN